MEFTSLDAHKGVGRFFFLSLSLCPPPPPSALNMKSVIVLTEAYWTNSGLQCRLLGPCVVTSCSNGVSMVIHILAKESLL